MRSRVRSLELCVLGFFVVYSFLDFSSPELWLENESSFWVEVLRVSIRP